MLNIEVEVHLPFAIIAFFVLGIERILYGYCFICTNHFKKSVDKNTIPGLSQVQKDDGKSNYWRCMQRLGMYIKVFQVSVCSYDLLVLDYENVKLNLFHGGMVTNPDMHIQLAIGILLIFAGQTLNYAVFKALGAKGVYYGYEFGYHVARVSCFPYNLHLENPQVSSSANSVLSSSHVFTSSHSHNATLLVMFASLISTGAWLCASLVFTSQWAHLLSSFPFLNYFGI